MAYRFTGFFARPVMQPPASLPEGAVWREIRRPFRGVGVRLGEMIGQIPSEAEVEPLLARLGLDRADDWLFLSYDCWAGQIDSVYGFGSRGGRRFGPVHEEDWAKVEAAYVGLMEEFGISEDDALHFQPFWRGFWGE